MYLASVFDWFIHIVVYILNEWAASYLEAFVFTIRMSM